MQVTFLAHSGFLIELDNVFLLFDWWKGELPPLSKKPLIVFASHWHEDHFSSAVFSLDAAAYVFGDMTTSWLENKGASPEVLEKALCISGNERCSPLPGIAVETLSSTDEGVAFLVHAEGQTIFHAGDLNWWHWEGEPDPWNPDMEQQFKQYAEPIRDRSIDLAMLPMDPRQEQYGFLGPKYFLELANIHHCLPMHQWEQFSFTQQFLNVYPAFTSQILSVNKPGESFTI